jgi:microcystin-dependent protein
MSVGQFIKIFNSSTGALTITYQDATSFTPYPSIASGGNLTATLVSTGTTNGTWVVEASNTAPASVPSGTILAFGGTTAPSGFLMCDGSSQSTSTYPNLFSAISYNYGGSGTSFNLPDARGKFLRGTDNMGTSAGAAGNDPDAASRTAQAAGGNTADNVGSVQSYQLQSHDHTGPLSGAGVSAGVVPPNAGNTRVASFTTDTFGGNETRPLNVYTNYIIKT